MRSGRLFEDFVPVSDTRALITTGHSLNRLDQIEMADYVIVENRVWLGKSQLVASGESLRLGGIFGRLVYSSAQGIVGAECQSPTAHQPFVKDGALYYTDDWPHVRIYRDGEVFVDHFGNMRQVGNPCWVGDTLYFEARSDDDPCRPDLWEVWRLNGTPEFVCMGANPSCWDGKLFIGEWNGQHFDYVCTSVA